ncbi:AEC family transporter [Actinotalea ferrariae]|uniref:AEC family transporter n=1 Tax=Actinotalea ferrariae TaxID=1386098 RepID=UPI001C8B7491|nr:AEC family transporter [Actinotalea ferrariae]MBX9243360.1 AEC family transporter [Actinotalea ferrariae]
MSAVLTALGTMAAIALVGWLLARWRALGPHAEQVLARAVFVIAAPSLLAVTIARADLGLLLSRTALVIAASTLAVVVVAALVLRVAWRRPAGEATIGTLAASYVNAGNLGIPIAVYLLGDAVAVVPTLLLQLLVLAPVAFTILDADADRRRASAAEVAAGEDDADLVADAADIEVGHARAGVVGRTRRVVGRTLRNPIIIGALTGVVLSVLPWDVPDVVLEPFRLIGAAAAPLALLTFGMSLVGLGRNRADRSRPRELVLVVVLRSVVHPLLAALLGRALGLDGGELLAVVAMAALPTAQNVLVYAVQYDRSRPLARDAGLATTLLAVPVLLAIATLLT